MSEKIKDMVSRSVKLEIVDKEQRETKRRPDLKIREGVVFSQLL